MPRPASRRIARAATRKRDHERELQELQAAHAATLRALQGAIRDTTRLTRLFTVLSEPAPLEVVLDHVLSTLSELFSSDVAVLLGRTEAGAFAPLRAIGLPPELLDRPMSVAPEDYLAAALRGRGPVVASGARDDPRVDASLRELDVETATWLPAMGNEAVEAVLLLGRCRPEPYSRSDLDLLMAMAYRIGLVLERARADNLLRRAQERLLQAEKLALAGKLAGSIAHEVNNPLACVRANLESLRLYLPAIQGTLRAARAAARFLAGVADPAGPALGQALVQAMGPVEGDAAGELSEIAGDTLEAAQRIGQLVASFMRLSSADLTLEPVAHDVRATIAACVAELPPDTGRPALRHDPGEGVPVIAWIAPDVLQAALTGLLRFLLAPGLHRVDQGGAVVVRAEQCQEGACIILSDLTLALSEEQRRSILDPRMDVHLRGGSTVRLGLVATLSHQLLRGCGAELSIEDHRPEGLELRIRLPAPPAGAQAP